MLGTEAASCLTLIPSPSMHLRCRGPFLRAALTLSCCPAIRTRITRWSCRPWLPTLHLDWGGEAAMQGQGCAPTGRWRSGQSRAVPGRRWRNTGGCLPSQVHDGRGRGEGRGGLRPAPGQHAGLHVQSDAHAVRGAAAEGGHCRCGTGGGGGRGFHRGRVRVQGVILALSQGAEAYQCSERCIGS